ncbi:xanthine and Co dehydrogenase maturation factor [Dictyobacter alpinus]|uniref:Xanthine and Co dehydrogenase maturation factor n=1 Tax=Dictyobacter alpinus TaxID=2014873 RepID=A0A402B078_9CHLR|nr:XdhC/CoxI family protein [Dictyobacter alpinus]GCE24750.1 xanthine and Co dehydrogenase maturation factor [Dictyobacter alpinus]
MSGLYEEFRDRLEQEHGIAIATLVSGSEQIGAKMLIYPDATTHGTLGSQELDQQVVGDATQAIWTSKAALHQYSLTQPDAQSVEVFIEGFPPPPELIIVGAGHIAIPLTTFAKTLNYRVVVIDARAAFATPERFPHADELIVAWPDEILTKRPLYPSTSIAVLTHDPKFDEPTLKVLLERHSGYIGAIGSRKTSAERGERLKQQGLNDEQLQRIYGPIGLDIGATSPEEIALSIITQIVAYRHGKIKQQER